MMMMMNNMNMKNVVLGASLLKTAYGAVASNCGADMADIVAGGDDFVIGGNAVDESAFDTTCKNADGELTGYVIKDDILTNGNKTDANGTAADDNVDCDATEATWQTCCCTNFADIEDLTGAPWDTLNPTPCPANQFKSNWSAAGNGTDATVQCQDAVDLADCTHEQYGIASANQFINNACYDLKDSCRMCFPDATAQADTDNMADHISKCMKAATNSANAGDSSPDATGCTDIVLTTGNCAQLAFDNTNLALVYADQVAAGNSTGTVCVGIDGNTEAEDNTCLALTTLANCMANDKCILSPEYLHHLSWEASDYDTTKTYWKKNAVCDATRYTKSSGNDGLSAGAIAGIVIGSIVAVGVIGVVVWYAMSK